MLENGVKKNVEKCQETCQKSCWKYCEENCLKNYFLLWKFRNNSKKVQIMWNDLG